MKVSKDLFIEEYRREACFCRRTDDTFRFNELGNNFDERVQINRYEIIKVVQRDGYSIRRQGDTRIGIERK